MNHILKLIHWVKYGLKRIVSFILQQSSRFSLQVLAAEAASGFSLQSGLAFGVYLFLQLFCPHPLCYLRSITIFSNNSF